MFSNINLANLQYLHIPEITNTWETGAVYTVLSVQMQDAYSGRGNPVITVEVESQEMQFRLPQDISLVNWANDCIVLGHHHIFPCRVEFGKLFGRFFAQIL